MVARAFRSVGFDLHYSSL